MTKGARSEDAILRAALDLMAEHGVGGLTVDAVAARAGVGKQTIYRHWGSRARLVHDAIACSDHPRGQALALSQNGALRQSEHGQRARPGVRLHGRGVEHAHRYDPVAYRKRRTRIERSWSRH